MSHVINNVTHNVVDDDGVFIIDPSSREITYEQSGEVVYFGGPVLVKGDHNSEVLTFKIPKTVEGHDMSTCNMIRIHYIVVDSATSSQYKDAYDVPSSARAVSEDGYFTFKWLIDRHVTTYAGPISFVVQFACTESTTKTETSVDEDTGEESTVEKTVLTYKYSLSTLPYTELSVSDAIVNDKQEAEEFVDEYNSIISQWYNELKDATAEAESRIITKLEQTKTSVEDQGENIWTATFGDGNTSTLKVRNGSKGSDGYSAYQVAKKNGFTGSESEWLDSLKALGYDECLKGITITQADYDSLSESEKNREDFVYIIKDAEIHAHTADHATSADSAITAADYTSDGGIAAALAGKASSDHTHSEITELNNVLDDQSDKITSIETTLAGMSGESEVVSITYNGSTEIVCTQYSYEDGNPKLRGSIAISDMPTNFKIIAGGVLYVSGVNSIEKDDESGDWISSSECTVSTKISDSGSDITLEVSFFSSSADKQTVTVQYYYECIPEEYDDVPETSKTKYIVCPTSTSSVTNYVRITSGKVYAIVDMTNSNKVFRTGVLFIPPYQFSTIYGNGCSYCSSRLTLHDTSINIYADAVIRAVIDSNGYALELYRWYSESDQDNGDNLYNTSTTLYLREI